MKELSIEEKAKAYDEAIERAKAYHNDYTQDIMEDIFPELKESEDEKIRKELIKYVKNWIAQGKNRGCVFHTWTSDEKECNEILAWLEKQKIEKQGKQKPAEWSEEDERMYRGLHNLIYSTPHCDSRKELSDWLKSLKDRVQPQLQQEWSEEDEKCIRLSTDIIDSALRAGFCVQLDRDRCVDWLKSLRPQNTWKPSDEQMKALRLLIISGISYVGQKQELIDLYNNLKKLKGE